MAKSARKTNGHGGLKLYKAYNFRTKDPVIDELRTLAEDHFGGKISYKMLKQMEEGGGPSVAAMAGWFFGGTERPQSPTVEAAGRSIGFKRTWTKMK